VLKESLGELSDVSTDLLVALRAGQVLVAPNTPTGYDGVGGYFVLLTATSLPPLGHAE